MRRLQSGKLTGRLFQEGSHHFLATITGIPFSIRHILQQSQFRPYRPHAFLQLTQIVLQVLLAARQC